MEEDEEVEFRTKKSVALSLDFFVRNDHSFEQHVAHIYNVVSFLRINFMDSKKWTWKKKLNVLITALFFCGAVYSTLFTIKVTFAEPHTPIEMSFNLLIISFCIQAVVSTIFLVYWQIRGHLDSFHRHVFDCQNGDDFVKGNKLIKKTVMWFYFILILEVVIIVIFEIKYYVEPEESHSELAQQRRSLFYFKELRWSLPIITLHSYIVWHVSMFLYIIYVNTAYVQVQYFNQRLLEMDGENENIEQMLLKKIDMHGRLTAVIRELDRIFSLYALIMLVIIIPAVIFTLMMMNERIHDWRDLLVCLPSVGLCAYSFLGVTVVPARLHDEIMRSRSCLLQNKSIWFPYRRDVYQMATTLCTHMEQYDLGVSVWGFAVLSRPLILATFSVMTMVLSVLIELSPQPTILQHTHHHHQSLRNFNRPG